MQNLCRDSLADISGLIAFRRVPCLSLFSARRTMGSLVPLARPPWVYFPPSRTTKIFVPQGCNSSGSVVLPLAKVAPAQGSTLPLAASHCCACFDVPRLTTVVFSDNGCSPSLKKKYTSASFSRRWLYLSHVVAWSIATSGAGSAAKTCAVISAPGSSVAQLISAGPVAVLKFLSITRLGARPRKITLPPALAKACRLSRAAFDIASTGGTKMARYACPLRLTSSRPCSLNVFDSEYSSTKSRSRWCSSSWWTIARKDVFAAESLNQKLLEGM